MAIVHSMGNPDVHVVLRGGKSSPNYSAKDVKETLAKVAKKPKLPAAVIVDCSHANSQKDHDRQPIVAQEIGQQLRQGQKGIVGVMIESNLMEGSQSLPKVDGEADFGHRKKASSTGKGTGGDVGEAVRSKLRYGVSITDACINWGTTVEVLEKLAEDVRGRREAVAKA